jgi:ribosomal protein S18 acetylase RimI-like enzyme
MKSLIKIRPAKNHDARRIYEFLCEKEEFLFDFREFEVNYRVCIANGDNIYLVAVDERNDATGFISCHGTTVLHEGGFVYEIKELFIEKKYRKMGVGKMLLKELQETLSKRIYQSLEISVNNKRSDLIQFYKNNGFDMTHVKLVHAKPKYGRLG